MDDKEFDEYIRAKRTELINEWKSPEVRRLAKIYFDLMGEAITPSTWGYADLPTRKLISMFKKHIANKSLISLDLPEDIVL